MNKSYADANKCNLEVYQSEVDQIKALGPHQGLIWGIPAAVGGTMLWIGIQGGSGEVAAAGAVLAVSGLGIRGLEHGVNDLKAHFSGKTEVLENIKEAKDLNKTDEKKLSHTYDLISKMDKTFEFSIPDLKRAISEAADDGELCDPTGKPLVKKQFRVAILRHLEAAKAIQNAAPVVQAVNPAAEIVNTPSVAVDGKAATVLQTASSGTGAVGSSSDNICTRTGAGVIH